MIILDMMKLLVHIKIVPKLEMRIFIAIQRQFINLPMPITILSVIIMPFYR